MPWHTLSSWKTAIFTQRFSSQLDAIRSEFKPPRSPAKAEPKVEQGGNTPATPSKKGDTETSSYANGRPERSSSEMEREDFQIICEFFAFAPPHTGDDNEVWASLAAHVSDHIID